jgi:hypothetical protein
MMVFDMIDCNDSKVGVSHLLLTVIAVSKRQIWCFIDYSVSQPKKTQVVVLVTVKRHWFATNT